jgi:tetratricopeptide (TPR) repeat protein
MKKLLIIFAILGIALAGKAQHERMESMMVQANQAYADSDYERALSIYDSVLSSGFESAALYFNSGNTHFKLGNIPAAILYYEKAKKMDPTDEDVLFNLELANSRIIDKMEPLPEFFLKTWFRSVRDIFPSDQWAKILVIFFIFSLAGIFFFISARSVLIRKISFWSAVASLFIVIASFIFSYNGYREYSVQSSGIIFTPTVTVKSSPNESSVDLFVIHEGTKIFITDTIEGWTEVRLSNGNVGWVRTNTYRFI